MTYPLTQFSAWLIHTDRCAPATADRYLTHVRATLRAVNCPPEDVEGILRAVQDEDRLRQHHAQLPIATLVDSAKAWGAYMRFLQHAGFPVTPPPSRRQRQMDYPHRDEFLRLAASLLSATTITFYDRLLRAIYRAGADHDVALFTLSAPAVASAIAQMAPSVQPLAATAWRCYAEVLSSRSVLVADIPRARSGRRPRAAEQVPELVERFQAWLTERAYAKPTQDRYLRVLLSMFSGDMLDTPARIAALTPHEVEALLDEMTPANRKNAVSMWACLVPFLSDVYGVAATPATSSEIKLPPRVRSAIWMLMQQAPQLLPSQARAYLWRDVSLYVGSARVDASPQRATRARLSDRAAALEFNWFAPLYPIEELWHFARGLQEAPDPTQPLIPMLPGGRDPITSDVMEALMHDGRRDRLPPLRNWHDGTTGFTAPEPPPELLASGAKPVERSEPLHVVPPLSSGSGDDVEAFFLESAAALEVQAATMADPEDRERALAQAADLRRRATRRGDDYAAATTGGGGGGGDPEEDEEN